MDEDENNVLSFFLIFFLAPLLASSFIITFVNCCTCAPGQACSLFLPRWKYTNFGINIKDMACVFSLQLHCKDE